MANKVLIAGVSAVLVVVVFLAIFLPVYLTQTGTEEEPKPTQLTPDQQFYRDVKDEDRFDCFPDLDTPASQELCEARGCFWKPATNAKAPLCFYPLTYGYQMTNPPTETNLGWEARLIRLEGIPSRYGADIDNLKLEVEFQTDYRLHFKISDAEKARYEVPSEAVNIAKPTKKPTNPMYEVSYKQHPFSIQVKRRSTGVTVFDSSVGGFTFEDQFLQISTKLPSQYVYGFGEHNHKRFLHDMDYKTWTMFTRDVAPVDEWNLYGHHPYHMCIENRDNNAHSILFLNSNAMDVTLQPTPALTYRTIGGVLDFYIFFGPTPENLVTQYTEAIGRPVMPPYWALGFQLSRWNYNSLKRVKEVVKEMNDAQMPLDVQYGDIDYMDRWMDFTVNETSYGTQNLSDFVDELHSKGMRYIIILDHCIGKEDGYQPYDTGLQQDIFVKTKDGNVLEGEVWPATNASVYPDFTLSDKAEAWWTHLCDDFHDKIAYDALWIDMNEPSNFVPGSLTGCDENKINNPPYLPNILGRIIWPTNKRGLYEKTICMDAQQNWGKHYDVHSLYGHSMSQVTHRTLQTVFPNKRSMVLSRSTYVSSGAYTGHWLGDNQSQWRQLPWSIPGMLEFSLFGFAYTGSDICGFWFNTTRELCLRWSQVGAFYPFARNHNGRDFIPQQPTAFDPQFTAHVKGVLEIRYRLLPFLYTLFYEANTKGTTVSRPVLHEFPETLGMNIDRQFLWGPSFLITPVLDEGETTVGAYIPDARWYDYHTHKEVDSNLRGKTTTLPADLYTINLHIRGGYVLPVQEPANNTVYSRKKPMGLMIALDDDLKARGNLFWDDGESRDTIKDEVYILVEFDVSTQNGVGTLNIVNIINKYTDPDSLAFETIQIMGLTTVPSNAKANNVAIPSGNFNYDSTAKGVLIVSKSFPQSSQHQDQQIGTGPTIQVVGKGVMYIFVAFLAIFLPVYLTQTGTEEEPKPTQLTPDQQFYRDVKDEDRFDCFPDLNTTATKELCEARGCFWKPATNAKAPLCFYPLTYGYQMTNPPTETNLGWEARLIRLEGIPSRYGADIDNLKLEVEFQTDYRLHFKITDAERARYEVPSEAVNIPKPTKRPSNPMYEVSYKQNPFSIQVKRTSTGVTVFDSSVGGFTFEDQFLQISTKLPSQYVYGFGEHNHKRFLHDVDYKTWTMFTRDENTDQFNDDWNLYGHHPYHMCVEERENNAHSILFLNTNAMDVTLQPTPALTYRTIGGVLDFYIFLGPKPENLVSQYTEAIGRPVMPPYWALGFQLSRWNYNSLDRVKEVVKEMTDAQMPMDVLYGDIDYMDRLMDFTVNETSYGMQNLSDFVDSLHDSGMRYIIILDPAIGIEDGYEPYDQGVVQDVFIRMKNGEILKGMVWPRVPASAFPDFTSAATVAWWTSLCDDFHDKIAYDALWIDMNEPSNFLNGSFTGCEDSNINRPPYIPNVLGRDAPERRGLYTRTICMDSQQSWGKHYDVHSLYGHSMAQATFQALQTVFPRDRSMILSRSTYVSSGAYTGHWLGDNQSQWRQLPWSIPGMLEFSLFGFTYIGADICGFAYNTTRELCLRWSQVGAFYPFSRNHNAASFRPQHPTSFDSEFTNNVKLVLGIRYKLLPFLYTLFYEAHTKGTTVARPVLHEFPETLGMNIDRQFLWGPSFLISPVLDEGMTTVEAYIPNARWYNYNDGKEVDTNLRGKTTTLPADLYTINLHIRGGYVLPVQEPANNTVYSRKKPMGLIIALDDDLKARGNLFWDDGESRDSITEQNFILSEFSVNTENGKGTLNIVNKISKYTDPDSLAFETIQIMGLTTDPTRAIYNETTIPAEDFNYHSDNKVLTLTQLKLRISQSHTVIWEPYCLCLYTCTRRQSAQQGSVTVTVMANKVLIAGVSAVLVVVVFLAIFLPVYLTQTGTEEEPKPTQLTPDQQFYQDVKDEERFDCFPDLNTTATKELCEARGCFWKPATNAKAPVCFYPLTYGYQMTSPPTETNLGWEARLIRLEGIPSRYGTDIDNLKLEVEFQTDYRLRLKITDAEKARYEVPSEAVNIAKPTKKPSNPMYEVSYKQHPFSIQVKRTSTGVTVFDSSVGGFTFEDQFLQISTKLPSRYVYGFGEHAHRRFLHDMNYKSWTMFTRDDEWNLYGHHPFHMCVEERGNNAHGILFLNSNAMEIILQPTPGLTYRTVGGVLDFYIFFGPTPENVVSQYTEAIGRPVMPPYWALGFQLSRWNYNSLDRVKEVVKEMTDAEMPLDVVYGDIDYMDRFMDFTVNETSYGMQNLSNFVDYLHDYGMRYIIILDHAIGVEDGYEPYDKGIEQDVFVKTKDDEILHGMMWPRVNASVFPDFTKSDTAAWWTALCDDFHDKIAYDALWIDMNEPSNMVNGSKTGCEENKLNSPPYVPDIHGRTSDNRLGLITETLCMDSEQSWGQHYNVHSLYGHSMSQATFQALQTVFPNKRSMVLSRSTYVSSGAYTGHWLGDNQSLWRQLPWSIPDMLEFSLFGFGYTGADICGFLFNTTRELCLRWSQVGAFYPFSRNHNAKDYRPQQPTSFDEEFTANVKMVLGIRYKLLPFLYTLFYEANTNGATVARPVLHEFPETRGMNIDRQFLWGPSFLITPVLDEGMTTVEAYIPNARWFNYYDGREVDSNLRGKTTTLPADLYTINLHIRGGYVLPFQEPANNTVNSRKKPMGLMIALDDDLKARGNLFWDDGESRDTVSREKFTLTEFGVVTENGLGTLAIDNIVNKYTDPYSLAFETIQIMGLTTVPTKATYNGTPIPAGDFNFSSATKVLTLTGLKLSISESHVVVWEP
ncbi:sucrase-isomaltase, intestinal-like [Acanthaster planci]|uniref:alpha-glucosidase n=1 Tax=Acanthaster planci TaxID=133434 RepID=A0A8B7Z3V1_ACAPL|nr:sucrase-isomaltase, intestinal-like [Acanthaster planci]